MFTHVMQYLFWILLSIAVAAVIVHLWVKWPEMKRSIEKARADRKAERERVESLDAYYNKLRSEQKEWFDKAYENVPAPWRARHAA